MHKLPISVQVLEEKVKECYCSIFNLLVCFRLNLFQIICICLLLFVYLFLCFVVLLFVSLFVYVSAVFGFP
mgnify:CR=1 FL=1